MSNSTTDPNEFRNKWNSHIDELTRLGWTIDDREDYEELQEAMETIKDIVDDAAENLEDDND